MNLYCEVAMKSILRLLAKYAVWRLDRMDGGFFRNSKGVPIRRYRCCINNLPWRYANTPLKAVHAAIALAEGCK